MRAAGAALLLAAALAAVAGARAPVAAAADPAEGRAIGRYRVTQEGDGIAIAAPRDRRLGVSLAAGGAVLLALGAGLVAAGRRGAGAALALLGIGVAAVGASGALGSTTVRANPSELARTGAGGRIERWPREAIAAVEVRRRPASAADFKRAGAHPWDVRLRAREGGHLPVGLAAGSEAEARALGGALAAALGLPPPE